LATITQILLGECTLNFVQYGACLHLSVQNVWGGAHFFSGHTVYERKTVQWSELTFGKCLSAAEVISWVVLLTCVVVHCRGLQYCPTIVLVRDDVYFKHYSAQSLSDAIKSVWTAFENHVL